MTKTFKWIRAGLPALIIIFFVLFSMVPTFYEWSLRWKIKPIRHFELVHNFPTDYELYLSKIRQGKEGAWLAKEKYTTEPHAGSLSQILYVFIGRVSDMVFVQTPYVWFSYHVMRIFFAGLLLFVMWKIVEWVFPHFSWQIIALLLAITASTWPKFETVEGWPRFGGYMPWYTVVDSLQRTTFLPHVMFGQAMLAFVLWVFAGGFISKKIPGNWIFLGIIGIVLGIIFPPAMLFIYGTLGFWSIFEVTIIFWNERTLLKKGLSVKVLRKILFPWFSEKLFGRIVFIAMTFPTLVYYALLLSHYPWKRLVEFDVLHPTKFSYIEYFLALGATLPLGLFGLVCQISPLGRIGKAEALQKKLGGFSVWVFSWLFFMFVFNFIPQQSPTRFTQMSPHIPLAILSMYGLYVAYEWIKKQTANRSQKIEDSIFLIPIIVILLGCGTMFSSWLWQKDFVDHKLRADIPLVPRGAEVMYPLLNLVDAMTWLQINTPRDVAVFSGPATGNLIPVYAGNYTFVGHANTVNSELKEIAVNNFFARKRPKEEFLEFFKANNIHYIIYGPEEQEMAFGAPDLRVFYPYLTEVNRNKYVIVYKINY